MQGLLSNELLSVSSLFGRGIPKGTPISLNKTTLGNKNLFNPISLGVTTNSISSIMQLSNGNILVATCDGNNSYLVLYDKNYTLIKQLSFGISSSGYICETFEINNKIIVRFCYGDSVNSLQSFDLGLNFIKKINCTSADRIITYKTNRFINYKYNSGAGGTTFNIYDDNLNIIKTVNFGTGSFISACYDKYRNVVYASQNTKQIGVLDGDTFVGIKSSSNFTEMYYGIDKIWVNPFVNDGYIYLTSMVMDIFKIKADDLSKIWGIIGGGGATNVSLIFDKNTNNIVVNSNSLRLIDVQTSNTILNFNSTGFGSFFYSTFLGRDNQITITPSATNNFIFELITYITFI